MKFIFNLLIFITLTTTLNSNQILIQYDNGSPRTGNGYSPGWEESVFLVPEGPCDVKEIYVYFEGNTPAKDTLYFTGDPGDGGLPGTFWVVAYNQRIAPVVVDYDGVPGWDTIKVNGLRSEGLDRICIQHKITSNGPTFAVDNNGSSTPLRSYVLDPVSDNTYGWPGIYYQASGDYMVRMLVEYDDFDYEENEPNSPPPPTLIFNSVEAGIVRENGDPIGSSQITIADWNSDGFDDVSIGSYKFENQGDATFKDVTSEMNMPGFSIWSDYDADGDLDAYVIREGKYVYDTTGSGLETVIDSSWVQFDTKSYMTFSQNTIFRNDDSVFTKLNQTDVFLMPYPNPCDDFDLPNKYINDSIHNPYVVWGPVWTDYNKDGYPDLYLGNRRSVKGYPNEVFDPDQLWKNNGNGTFSRVTDECNIGELQKHKSGESRNQNNLFFNGQDASACDYNMDNNIDIHMINYGLERDFVWKNNGDGTFDDVASSTGLDGKSLFNPNPDALTHGHSCEWADFNNDGYPDVAVGNLAHPDWRGLFSNPSTIYMNEGPPNFNFRNVGPEMGLKFFESDCGVLWLDYDFDGFQDIWVGQRYDKLAHIYKNMGPPNYKLKEVTWELGSLEYDKWTAARFDYDNDGDEDVMVGGLLYRNDVEKKGKFVGFRIGGSPENGVTTEGFGTKLTIHSGNKLFYRELMGATSGPRHRQNSFEIIIGLGNIDKIDSLVVSYVNNESITHSSIELNTKYFIPYMEPLEKSAITTPLLIFPKNNSSSHNDEITLIWEKSGGSKKYQVVLFEMIRNGDDFDIIDVLDTLIDIDELSISELVNSKTYYWKVRAINESDSSHWSSIWDFTIGNTVPNSPILSLPSNMSEENSTIPSFSWEDAIIDNDYPGKKKYQIQISKFESFNVIDLDTVGIKNTFHRFSDTLKPETDYYWRVRCFNNEQDGEWSETWRFKTIELPKIASLLEPADKSEEVSIKPKFKWDDIENAYSYHITLATDDEFSELAMDIDHIKTSQYRNLSLKLLQGTDYYWRVRGLNPGGYGSWSETWSFTTEGTKPNVEDKFDKDIQISDISVYPNPASLRTKLSFVLNQYEFIEISITNLAGKLIKKLSSKFFKPGLNEIDVDCTKLTQGSYYISLSSSRYSEDIIIVVVK